MTASVLPRTDTVGRSSAVGTRQSRYSLNRLPAGEVAGGTEPGGVCDQIIGRRGDVLLSFWTAVCAHISLKRE